MKSVFLSLVLCTAMLLGYSRAAPTLGSLPLGGFPGDSQFKLVGSGGSGNGVHYQDIRCRLPASKIATAAPPLIRGLQAMSSNLSMIVTSIADSLNLTVNTLKTALHQGIVLSNLTVNDIHSSQRCNSEQDLDEYQCNVSRLIPYMRCYSHLLGEMLTDATNQQIDSGANHTYRSELYQAYGFANFTVDLEQMVMYSQCGAIRPSCITTGLFCPSYSHQLQVMKNTGYFPMENLNDLKKLGLLFKMTNAYDRLLRIIEDFQVCSATLHSNGYAR